MSKKQEHQPERFERYVQAEDKTGFFLPDNDFFFKYDKFGGWKDQYGNIYNRDGEPVYDQYEYYYGPNEQIQDDYEEEVPQSQKILEKISHNMSLIEEHDRTSPLRVYFEILDLKEQEDPPSKKELFQFFSKKVKEVFNVFYGENHQFEDQDSDEDADQFDDLEDNQSEQGKGKKVEENQKKEEQKTAEKQPQKNNESEEKQTQNEEKIVQSKEDEEKMQKKEQPKEEQKQEQKKETITSGYFVIKNIKGAEQLIHLEGHKFQEFNYEITFDIEPVHKLIADPLNEHEKKQYVEVYLDVQKLYAIFYEGEEGFSEKQEMMKVLGHLQIANNLKKIVKPKEKEKEKKMKIPLVQLNSESDLNGLMNKILDGKKIIVEKYSKNMHKPN